MRSSSKGSWICRLGVIVLVFLISHEIARSEGSRDVRPRQSIIQEAEQGDLIFRYSGGVLGTLAARMSPHDHRFSHVGIVVVEDGVVDVIHADASPRVGPPRVVRESIAEWIDGVKTLGLYRVKAAQQTRNRIAQEAQRLFNAGIAFDSRFDDAADDKLYCTKLVAKAVSLAQSYSGETPVVFAKNRFVDGRLYLPVDSLYLSARVAKVVDTSTQ